MLEVMSYTDDPASYDDRGQEAVGKHVWNLMKVFNFMNQGCLLRVNGRATLH